MRWLVLIAATVAAPLAAQDLQPALDPVQLGQGLTLSATMRAQADRDARRLGYRNADEAGARATCRNARRMDRPSGARVAKFDKLLDLCRQAGY